MDNPAGFDHDETCPGPSGEGRSAAMITIELFGVPRLRAGIPFIRLEAVDVGSALRALANACPTLDGSVLLDGRVRPSYKLSLNGDRFVTEPDTGLIEGDVLLLLAADVGG
jgi:molybdopterin converting factor small subunit